MHNRSCPAGSLKVLLVLAAILPAWVASGCGGGSKSAVPYTVGRKGGNAVLSLGKLTLVFEGIAMEGKDDPTLSTGAFRFPGAGEKSGGTVTVNEVKITESRAPGVVTVVVNNYAFKLLENDRKLALADQSFRIDEGPQTVVVDKAGIIKAELKKK